MPQPSVQYVSIDGIKLAYFDKSPEYVRTIVFIHGNSGSAKSWEAQFSIPAFNQYRLLAFDLPAHGNSGGSANPEFDYTLPRTAEIISKALNLLCNSTQNIILVGFSYGANVVAEMLAFSKDYKGLVLLGPTILGKNFSPNQIFKPGDSSLYFQCDTDPLQVVSFFENILYKSNEANTILLVQAYNQVKPPFRSTLLKVASEGHYLDEIAILSNLSVPVLVVFGENDSLVYNNYLDDTDIPRWNNTTYLLSEAGHYVHLDQLDQFNEILHDYVKDRFS